MLPDWPMPKGELQRSFMRALARELRQRSFVRDVVSSPVFEGHGTAMMRADGTYEERDFSSAGAEQAIPIDAIKTESIADMFGRMGPMLDSLAKSQSESIQKVFEEGVRSVGNEVNADGNPISAELILTALDRVLMDFSADGQPIWPTIVIPPIGEAKVAAELVRINTEPELKQRLGEILQKKRDEYLAREADRVLVG